MISFSFVCLSQSFSYFCCCCCSYYYNLAACLLVCLFAYTLAWFDFFHAHSDIFYFFVAYGSTKPYFTAIWKLMIESVLHHFCIALVLFHMIIILLWSYCSDSSIFFSCSKLWETVENIISSCTNNYLNTSYRFFYGRLYRRSMF